MEELINNQFGGKIRIRVCGLLVENEKILLVEHTGLNQENSLWLPPGGGVIFGETLEEALLREFKEESGLDIVIDEFICIFQHISLPLHAVEIFFKVSKKGGKLVLGTDPELGNSSQIISKIQYVTLENLRVMNEKKKHKIFWNSTSFEEILNKRGLFT